MTTHRTRAQQRIDELDTSPTRLLAEIERLKGELETARKESDEARRQADEARRQGDEYLAGLQRERAEFLNYRRRAAEEREQSLGLASESLLLKVVALADDFDRAIEAMPGELRSSDDLRANAWSEGIVAIDRKLRSLLESEGVRVMEAMGRTFDPREHEAVANVPGTGRPEGEVVAEVQRGYRLRDRVLRPALVAVAQGDHAAGEGPAGGGPEADTRPSNDDASPGRRLN